MTPAWVFDLDGTVADCSHRLHFIKKAPKDWPGFFAETRHDLPIEPVCRLARDLDRTGVPIVFASGRSDECRAETMWWIEAYIGFESPRLFMRRAGDHRDDSLVKVEMLAQIRAAGFEPIIWFEDRDRVVKSLRAAGVKVAQVAPGDF